MSHEKRERRGWGRLRKLPSGRWQAAYIGPDNALHKNSNTFEDEDAARGWLSRERRLIDNEDWTSPADRAAVKKSTGTTFGQYADEWLKNRRTRSGDPLKARTAADYRRYLDKHLLPELGQLPIRSITEARVRDWYDGMDPSTPTERAHAYQLLRAICTTATEKKVLPRNPCTIQGAGRTKRAKTIRPAEVAEFQAIADNMPARLKVAVLLGGWCALRYGEIAELRRRDIDLKRGIITVARGVTWPMTKAEDGKLQSAATVSTPKSSAGIRDVHIPPHILPDLAEHLVEFAEVGRDGMLFPSSTGGHIHPRTFGWQFHKAREKAGRPDLRFHDLRHTGAVLAARTGATIAELMSRLGHSTPAAAMRYQHSAAERDRAIAEALSKMAGHAE